MPNTAVTNLASQFRVLSPEWWKELWVHIRTKLVSLRPEVTETAAMPREANPGLDEYGRVEFAMPGYGTC
jgi:hypothetical protein